MKKLTTLALMCAAAMAAMTFTSCDRGGDQIPGPVPPEPEPAGEQILIAGVADMTANMNVPGSNPGKEYVAKWTNNVRADSAQFSKTVRDWGMMVAKNGNIETDRGDKKLFSDVPNTVYRYDHWNDAGRPPFVNDGNIVAGSKGDSVLYRATGNILAVKKTGAQTYVINLTEYLAANEFDAQVAAVPNGNPFIVKDNGFIINVMQEATLSRFGHPAAPMPGADGWCDTDPKYGIVNSSRWELGTGLYTGDRANASNTAGVETKFVSSSSNEGTISHSYTDKNRYLFIFEDKVSKTDRILIKVDGPSWPNGPIYNISNPDKVIAWWGADLSRYVCVVPGDFELSDGDSGADRLENQRKVAHHLSQRGVLSSQDSNAEDIVYLRSADYYAKQVALGQIAR